jgi:hypothetical protein
LFPRIILNFAFGVGLYEVRSLTIKRSIDKPRPFVRDGFCCPRTCRNGDGKNKDVCEISSELPYRNQLWLGVLDDFCGNSVKFTLEKLYLSAKHYYYYFVDSQTKAFIQIQLFYSAKK